MTRSLRITLLAAAALFVLSIHHSAQAGPSFMSLGDLSGGAVSSFGIDISADGLVVVGRSSSDLGVEAMRWSSGSAMVGLSDLPGGDFFSSADAASADGSVIVGNSTSGMGGEAFRWTTGGMVGLGDLPGGSFFSIASGVSADGSVVVGSSSSGPELEAFRWTSGGMVGLGSLTGGNGHSEAYDVSADGSVLVGLVNSALGNEAMRWTSGGMVGLGVLAGGPYSSIAQAVSGDGLVVVGRSSSASGAEAFRWTSGTGMVGLGDLPGGDFISDAFDVSADGSVVVGLASSDSANNEAFVWDAANGMRSVKDILVNDYGFDLTGWTLNFARGVSADGMTIAGWGNNPDGDREAWIANIVPIADLDIKPGSDPNSVNLKSHGVLPVAILTTDDFNALDVDVATILFGDPVLLNDGGTGVGPLLVVAEDVEGDGDIDLSLKFKIPDLIDNGALGNMSVAGILSGETFDGTPFAGSDSIRLVPPGDANNDSIVNAADYTIWANNIGTKGAKLSDGDFNEDRKVDARDYIIWANNFATNLSAPQSATAAVPEPSTLALTVLGLIALLDYRWRRRKRA